MTEPAFGQAKFARNGDVMEAKMKRVLDDSLDRVWVALTDF